MKTILVTGAMGTIGSYAVGLAEAAGHRVVVSDRELRGLRAPVRGEVRGVDITDAARARELVRGVDVVVHTAAQLSVSADAAELARTNSDAVVALFEAACIEGVRRFVHVSTATLYRRQPGDGPANERTPLAPTGPFTLSKHGAETYLRGKMGNAPTEITILRPAPVYGRRGRHFAASLLAFGPILRLLGPVLPRPSGGPLGTMVHAEDVARAALFVSSRAEAKDAVFNVADGDVLPLGVRLATTLDAYGLRSSPRIPMPDLALRTAGSLFAGQLAHAAADRSALLAWRAVVARHGLKPALRPHLDREAVPLLREDLVVDASALRALGWTPRFGRFAEGFREVLRWYQSERWVPRYG